MTNKEKFLSLVSDKKTNTLERNRERIKNRLMLRESQKIAIKVLTKLDELKWTQRDLANALNVSPQQVTKIVSGKENLTIDTQIKLQNVLNIPILATFYEKKMGVMEEWILTIEKRVEKIVAQTNSFSNNYQASKIVKVEKPASTEDYFQMVG
ncbi:helix-turn-helix transcriptional regulator [Flavobacterium sp.]|jgi:transcriptional regulator with XRE-family HTH domain|uniref:helix-turn-helix transcriptional regulator n=1 Tax=Flavobacterium sp. TaxID=239 RepID=UPI00333E8368